MTNLKHKIIAKISAGAVVYRQTEKGIEVLTIHRPLTSDFTLPKGHVDKGESLQETAIREVKEETGYNIEIENYLSAFEYHVAYEKEGVEFWRNVYWFLATPIGEQSDVINPEEVEKVEWHPIDDAIKNFSYENDKDKLRQAKEIILTKQESSQLCITLQCTFLAQGI